MKDHRVAEVRPNRPSALQADLLFHFCRMQLPTVSFNRKQFDHHLQRAFDLFMAKVGKPVAWETWLENLYPLDWYLASACLDGDRRAWDHLFAARASRVDCLLVDALRARAMRLYPRNEERQESAVTEFWSHLLVADTEGTLADLVHQTGMYYEDRLKGAGFERVILAGAGAAPLEHGPEIEEARRSLEDRLRTTVEPVDPRAAAALTDRITAAPALLDALTPLVGLLLRDREKVPA